MARLDREYIIPLRKVRRRPRTSKAKTAVKIVREFLLRHTKADEVLIGTSINEMIWSGGMESVPKRIRVHAIKDDKTNVTYAELPGIPIITRDEMEKEKEKEAEKKPAKKDATGKDAKPKGKSVTEEKPAEEEKEKPKEEGTVDAPVTANDLTPTTDKDDEKFSEAKTDEDDADAAAAAAAAVTTETESATDLPTPPSPPENDKEAIAP